jgi:hypothetical protein
MARQDPRLAHTQALGVSECDPSVLSSSTGEARWVVTLTDTQWVEQALRLAGRAVEDHDGIRIVDSLREAKAAVQREVR